MDIGSFETSIIEKLIKHMEDINLSAHLCDQCSGLGGGCDKCNDKGYRDWIDEIRRPL